MNGDAASGGTTELSLVLPCYNEAPWLRESVDEIVRTLDFLPLRAELILVDDGSRDGTAEIIRGLALRHPGIRLRAIFHARNLGWGAAVADGIRAATGELVGYLDVDLEIPPSAFAACVQAVREGADIAVGARVFKFVPGGLWRRALSRAFALLVRLILPIPGLGETTTGCKCYRRSRLLPVFAQVREPGWFWDLEVMARARLAGLSVALVPCLYIRNPAKPSSVRVLADGWDSLRRLWAFRRTLRAAGLRRGARASVAP